jgi:hypothetical protein
MQINLSVPATVADRRCAALERIPEFWLGRASVRDIAAAEACIQGREDEVERHHVLALQFRERADALYMEIYR